MAITAPIPLPGQPGEILAGIPSDILRNRLMEAQAQEALGSASKSKMLANLIDAAIGGQMSEQSNLTNSQSQGMSPYQSDQNFNTPIQTNFSSEQPLTRQQKAIELGQMLGFFKETPSQQASREVKTAWSKELGATDAKQLDKWNEAISTSNEIEPVLQNIRDIAADPVFQSMYKNPEYFGYDLAWLKRFGTPEQQDMLARVGTNAKSIFSSLGQEFKGAFREFEYKLFKNATPDEVNDTLPQIIAKTNTLMALRDLSIKRLTLAQNIVRQSQGQISPASAMEIAKKQINGNDVTKRIESEFKEINQRLKSQRNMQSDQNSNPIPNKAFEVEIYNPSGELVARGSKEAAAKFLKTHRGHYQKVIK